MHCNVTITIYGSSMLSIFITLSSSQLLDLHARNPCQRECNLQANKILSHGRKESKWYTQLRWRIRSTYESSVLHHVKGPWSKCSVPGREQLLQEAAKGLWLQFHQALALLTKPDHEISCSPAVACPPPWLRSSPLMSVCMNIWKTVNQALEVVLFNNSPLPKEGVFNPAYFSHRVQCTVLPTSASAQWGQQAALQNQKNNELWGRNFLCWFHRHPLEPSLADEPGAGWTGCCLPAARPPRDGALPSAEVDQRAAGAPSDARLTQFRLRRVVTFLSNCPTRLAEG